MVSVMCGAVAPPLCTYRWTDTSNDEALSDGQELHLVPVLGKQYKFQCQIVCPIRGKTCAFDYDKVFCNVSNFLALLCLCPNRRSEHNCLPCHQLIASSVHLYMQAYVYMWHLMIFFVCCLIAKLFKMEFYNSCYSPSFTIFILYCSLQGRKIVKKYYHLMDSIFASIRHESSSLSMSSNFISKDKVFIHYCSLLFLMLPIIADQLKF